MHMHDLDRTQKSTHARSKTTCIRWIGATSLISFRKKAR